MAFWDWGYSGKGCWEMGWRVDSCGREGERDKGVKGFWWREGMGIGIAGGGG